MIKSHSQIVMSFFCYPTSESTLKEKRSKSGFLAAVFEVFFSRKTLH